MPPGRGCNYHMECLQYTKPAKTGKGRQGVGKRPQGALAGHRSTLRQMPQGPWRPWPALPVGSARPAPAQLQVTSRERNPTADPDLAPSSVFPPQMDGQPALYPPPEFAVSAPDFAVLTRDGHIGACDSKSCISILDSQTRLACRMPTFRNAERCSICDVHNCT